MISLQPDPDMLADQVVVVARHRRQDMVTARQTQRIENIGATKRLTTYLGPERAFVIVDNIIGAQQYIHISADRKFMGQLTDQFAELQLHPALVNHLSRDKNTLAYKLRNEAAGR